MPVSTDSNKKIYNGTGSTDTYTFPYKLYLEADLIVTEIDDSGVETDLVLDTDYTVALISEGEDGANVIRTAGNLPSDYGWVILRELPLTQEIDFEEGSDAFLLENLNEAVDRLTMQNQQQQEEVDRSFKIGAQNEGIDLTLPIPEATKAIKWNTAGDGLENSTYDPDEAATEAQASADAAAISESNASADAAASAISAAEAAANVGNFETAQVSIKIDNYLLTSGDKGKLMIMNSGVAKAFTFPDIVGNEVYLIKNIGVGTLTLTPDGSDTIETSTLDQEDSVILSGDLSNNKWRVISRNIGSDADEKVKIDALATAGYLGAAYNDGVLRSDNATITYTDGGDFATIQVPSDGIQAEHLLGLTGTGSIDTSNIPEGTNKYSKIDMEIGSYTGTGSTETITGLGFRPQFVEIFKTDGISVYVDDNNDPASYFHGATGIAGAAYDITITADGFQATGANIVLNTKKYFWKAMA